MISKHSQFIHAIVQLHNDKPWLLTGVYASTSIFYRNKLWDHLTALNFADIPWCIVGDHCILNSYDQLGGWHFLH